MTELPNQSRSVEDFLKAVFTLQQQTDRVSTNTLRDALNITAPSVTDSYELRDVHEEAERLEHAVSDHFVEAIARKLGHPEIDPHGDPIPSAEGVIAQRDLRPLSALAPGIPATISQLKTNDAEMLQHMLDRGFRLNARVEVVERDPFKGPITALVDGKRRVIGHHVAENVLVATENSDED
jgi:DtxR family Mn-dependent transcriptional regulator